jgi:dihydrofolate reductase
MELVCIVAVASNGVIGKDNSLPWKLKEDLRRFKEITMGAPLIMGRKNHESIGRALPGRPNLVLSRNDAYQPMGDAILCPSLDAALSWCLLQGFPRAFLIGGSDVYAEGLDYCDRLVLTEVCAEVDGDAFFQYEPEQWREVRREVYPASEFDQYPVVFRELERVE